MDVELMSWLIQLHQQPLSMFFFELNTVTFSYKYGWYLSLSMSSEKHTISVFSIKSLEGFHTTMDFAIPYRINE
jgi:hypothetical protein